MLSEVETSLIVEPSDAAAEDGERSLDFARDDKATKINRTLYS
jgi:hypothetical protein